MLKAIFYARKLIERQVKQNSYELIGSEFTKYQKGFYWTNENIACYLNMFDLRSKSSALSVAGSGDHIFNLVNSGIKDIDSFDINKLTEYLILGLKRAMIIKYDYFEFMTMINYISYPGIPLETLTDFIHDLLPYMDDKHRLFWQEISNFNYRIQKRHHTNLNLMQMLYVGVYASSVQFACNNYLADEYSYENFRWKLQRANITFRGVDALDLPKEYAGKKYDLILLSNILDYANTRWGDNWDYEKLEAYVKELEGLTNDGGVIFLKYILSYITKDGVKEKIFHDSAVKESDLKEEMYTILKPSSSEEYDGLILKRIKIDK